MDQQATTHSAIAAAGKTDAAATADGTAAPLGPVAGSGAVEQDTSAAVAGPTWTRLEDQLAYYSRASRRAKQSFQRFKVAELVVAAAVPVVAALQAPAAVTAVLAALVVVAEGLQQLFGWQRDWLSYRGVLQALKREKFLFLAGAEPYTRSDRHRILASRLEDLIAGENSTWVETHTPRNDQRHQQHHS